MAGEDIQEVEQLLLNSTDSPQLIYSYEEQQDILHWTNLATGIDSSVKLVRGKLCMGCCWSEVPGGGLLITGDRTRVTRIDTLREFAVTEAPPMITARMYHFAVYHAQHVYVLGGYGPLANCERYVCEERRWEPLPPLPQACSSMCGVVVEESLYSLGGTLDGSVILDLIQKLSLERLTWEVLQLRLPVKSSGIPCFKLSTQVYFVLDTTLYSFEANPLRIQAVKGVTGHIKSWRGPSYYSKGTLYCSFHRGKVIRVEIGSLRC
jgi:hypothetical protein